MLFLIQENCNAISITLPSMLHNHVEDQSIFCNKTVCHKTRLTTIDGGRDHLSHSRIDDAGVNFSVAIDQRNRSPIFQAG
jgi:hypothetical protein